MLAVEACNLLQDVNDGRQILVIVKRKQILPRISSCLKKETEETRLIVAEAQVSHTHLEHWVRVFAGQLCNEARPEFFCKIVGSLPDFLNGFEMVEQGLS